MSVSSIPAAVGTVLRVPFEVGFPGHGVCGPGHFRLVFSSPEEAEAAECLIRRHADALPLPVEYPDLVALLLVVLGPSYELLRVEIEEGTDHRLPRRRLEDLPRGRSSKKETQDY
jgi:hypothetical protein